MNFHKIAVEISDSEVFQLVQFINILGDIKSSVSVKKTDTLKGEGISFFTFVVEVEAIQVFLLKIKSTEFKVVSADEINDRLYHQRKSISAKMIEDANKIGIEGLKHLKKNMTIQDFINEGEYNELLSILKNIKVEQSKRQEAEKGIPLAVKNAIEMNFHQANMNKSRALPSFKELISIATNSQLKDIKLNLILENAGNKAIQICTAYKDYISELVSISNNIKMPYIICIKAIVKFSEITLEGSRRHKAEYDDEINFAIKNSNLRWLRIALDTIGNIISWEEKKHFEDYLSFIEFKKLGN